MGFPLVAAAALSIGAGSAMLGVCGPFTDVTDAGFCPFVLEIFTLGITTGTSPTTYDPGSSVSRLQMAAFLSRTVDRALQRGSRRAALRQFWSPQSVQLALTATLAGGPLFPEFDGADVWVGLGAGRVSRIRSSDGLLLETWTGVADEAGGVLIAMGKVFVAARGNTPGPTGRLYRIDPSLPAGAATTVATGLPHLAFAIAFDGGRIWTANRDGTVSIVTPGATLPWTVTTTAGGYQVPMGILHDGANIWITDPQFLDRPDQLPVPGTLLKLSGTGGVLQTVTVGSNPAFPIFDASNIWVPNSAEDSVSVVRASNGAVLATLTGNGLSNPIQAAFDGQRVLLTNFSSDGSVSVWKAADLTPLGTFPMPAGSVPIGACSDGVNFWISLNFSRKLARF
jgi:sugar lactone lactonase YvrE